MIAKRWRFPARLLMAAFGAVALAVPQVFPVGAHGETGVVVDPLVAQPGDEITVSGEGFDENGEAEIYIDGPDGRLALGTVATDETGDFARVFTLPDDLPAGSYSVTAAGPDESASSDFTVSPAAGGGEAAVDHADEPAHDEGDSGFRAYSSGEIIGLSLALAAVIVIGFFLVLPRARTGESGEGLSG